MTRTQALAYLNERYTAQPWLARKIDRRDYVRRNLVPVMRMNITEARS